MRIFATVGTPLQPLNRMVEFANEALDRLVAEGIPIEGIFQYGTCTTRPRHLTPIDFVGRSEFEREMDVADVVLCHGGVGSIHAAIAKGHFALVVARRPELGEHIHDALPVTQAVADTGLIANVTSVEVLTDWLRKFARGECRRQEPHADVVAPAALAAVAQAFDRVTRSKGRAPRWELLRPIAALGPALAKLRVR